MPNKLTMSATDWAALVVLSVLWGGSFFLAKVAVTELPPLTLAFGRVAIAAAILAILAVVPRAGGKLIRPLRQNWRDFAVLGLTNCAIPFSLFFWAQIYIPSGLASIFNATTPIFTALIAHATTHDEKLNAAKIAGVAAGFLGVTVMLGFGTLGAIGKDLLASLACLLAAISYAVAGVYGRRLGAGPPPIIVAAGQLLAASVLLLPVALVVERPWTLAAPSPTTLAALLALAALSTALAYVIYFRVLARAGATNVLLVTFLIPVSAILLGTAVLGERLTARELAGMALIGIGLAVMDGRPLRLASRKRG